MALIPILKEARTLSLDSKVTEVRMLPTRTDIMTENNTLYQLRGNESQLQLNKAPNSMKFIGWGEETCYYDMAKQELVLPGNLPPLPVDETIVTAAINEKDKEVYVYTPWELSRHRLIGNRAYSKSIIKKGFSDFITDDSASWFTSLIFRKGQLLAINRLHCCVFEGANSRIINLGYLYEFPMGITCYEGQVFVAFKRSVRVMTPESNGLYGSNTNSYNLPHELLSLTRIANNSYFIKHQNKSASILNGLTKSINQIDGTYEFFPINENIGFVKNTDWEMVSIVNFKHYLLTNELENFAQIPVYDQFDHIIEVGVLHGNIFIVTHNKITIYDGGLAHE